MPLTRIFKQTVMERIKNEPGFRRALLRETIDEFLTGDVEVAKTLLRDYINATMSFDTLGKKLNKNSKSLQRMLGPSGNPTSRSLFTMIKAIQAAEKIRLDVRVHKQ